MRRRLDGGHGGFNFLGAQGIERVRAGFNHKGFIQARLEYFIDEVVGHVRGIVLEYHRHAQFQAFAIEHGHFTIGLDLDVGAILGNNEDVGVVIIFDRGAERFQGALQRHHFCRAAVGLGLWREADEGQRQGQWGHGEALMFEDITHECVLEFPAK